MIASLGRPTFRRLSIPTVTIILQCHPTNGNELIIPMILYEVGMAAFAISSWQIIDRTILSRALLNVRIYLEYCNGD